MTSLYGYKKIQVEMFRIQMSSSSGLKALNDFLLENDGYIHDIRTTEINKYEIVVLVVYGDHVKRK